MHENNPEEKVTPADRLCSEIQLFDLCDLETCRHRRERYCTNEELLAKFEAIREEDDRDALVYAEDELEEDEDLEYNDFDSEDYDAEE